MPKTINVVENAEKPVPVDVMAESIVEIAAAMKKIAGSRLSRKALVVLIAHNSKLGMGQVEIVLNNLEALEEIYLKPKPKTGRS